LKTTVSAESDKFFELDHGLQCAALLEKSDPSDIELQVAGLIHDLAHPWDGPGQPRHATMGAEAVRPILGDRVAALIEGHVPAKRFLVTTRPEYRALLSEDSIMTLAAQGGDLTDAEVAAFTTNPWWEAMVALRIGSQPIHGGKQWLRYASPTMVRKTHMQLCPLSNIGLMPFTR
ncbi:MAG: hypothetical protein RIS69_1908, partial [Actinomycetota bacterium]